MLAERDITALPRAAEPALLLADADNRAEVERAYEKIALVFWGPRIPLDVACADILTWLERLSADA